MSAATWPVRAVMLLGAALLGCSGECDVDDDLRHFAGDAALDCGMADGAHPRTEVDTCATNAFDAGNAFMARYQPQGTDDSKLVTAVAMNSAGDVKIFRWDSSPCGGGSCSAVTDVQACEGPKVTLTTSEDPGALPLSCSSLGLAQRICE